MNPSNTGSLRPTSSSSVANRRRNHEERGTDVVEEVVVRNRVRSGSWGGVDESDEDEAHIRHNAFVGAADPSMARGDAHFSGGNGSGDSGYSGQRGDQSSYELPDYGNMSPEEKLRRKLKFFFMNPVEKFLARRQTPWKLFLQFAKVLLVTTQLIIFGNFRFAHTNFYSNSRISFEHLFFRDWDTVREITTYPPSDGKYALYKREDFYNMFNEAAQTFRTLEEVAVAPYKRNSTLDFCIESFDPLALQTRETTFSEHLGLSRVIGSTKCISIPDKRLLNFSSVEYLKERDFEVHWDSLQSMHINFTIRTHTYQVRGAVTGTECFVFNIYIEVVNDDYDGQLPLALILDPDRVHCESQQLTKFSTSIGIRIINFLIIAICSMSFILCLRAIIRAQILRAEAKEFFRTHLQGELCLHDQLKFLNLWYVVICINDVLIIIGSVITELIETTKSTADLWDFSCIFLGTGNLLVWIGMLRYLGFFEAYNALILTLKGSLPNVARFAMCAAFVYAGYLFCGWLVFAPYHFKFKSLQSTSECLFSLIDGDDMFATFSMMSEKVGLIHGFSRVYLYTFVMLFIYVVLSLFIAIIMDTYENIKQYYVEGFPKGKLEEFYTSKVYDVYSTSFYDGSSPGILYYIWCWAMTKLYGRSWNGYDRMVADRIRNSETESEHDPSPILT